MTPLLYFLIFIFLFFIGFLIMRSGVLLRKEKKIVYTFIDGTDGLDQECLEILKLTNLYRNTKELSTLKNDKGLNESAKFRVGAMIFDRMLSHRGFVKMSNDLMLKGIEQVGENIGYGYHSATAVTNAWFVSDSHRINIESNWKYMGIHVGTDSMNGRKYYCQIFAK